MVGRWVGGCVELCVDGLVGGQMVRRWVGGWVKWCVDGLAGG